MIATRIWMRRILLLLGGVVVLTPLGKGMGVHLPPEFTLLFLWVGVLLLPGHCVLSLLFPRESFDALERLPLAFCLSLLYLSIPAVVLYALRARLTTVWAVFLLSIGALLALYWIRSVKITDRRAPPSSFFPADIRVLLLGVTGGLAVVSFVLSGYAFTINSNDVWAYQGFVRKMYESGAAMPENPFLLGEGVEVVYGYNLWFLLQSLFSFVAGMDPIAAWAQTTLLTSLLVLLAIYPFAATLFERNIALAVSFVYAAFHVAGYGLHFLIHSAYPAHIATWIFTPIVFTFVYRFIRGGERRYLVVGALTNAALILFHFAYPAGNILALGFAWVFGFLWSVDQNERRRIFSALIALTGAFVALGVWKFQYYVFAGGEYVQSYVEQARASPIFLGRYLYVGDPSWSVYGNGVVVVALLLAPVSFVWLRGQLPVQFLLATLALNFIILSNPILTQAISGLAHHAFVRKGIYPILLFAFILVAVVLISLGVRGAALLSQVSFQRLRMMRGQSVVMGLLLFSVVISTGVYFFHSWQSLKELTHSALSIPERDALKRNLLRPVIVSAYALFMLFLAMEFFYGSLSRLFGRWLGAVAAPAISLRALRIVAAVSVLATVVGVGGVYGGKVDPNGRPYPRTLESIIPPHYQFLRDALDHRAVVLTEPRRSVFEIRQPIWSLQAFTAHYGVALPGGDYKQSKSSIKYIEQLKDAQAVFGAQVGRETVDRVVRKYGVEFIVLEDRKQLAPLYSVLSSSAGYKVEFETSNAVIFSTFCKPDRSEADTPIRCPPEAWSRRRN